MSRLVVATLKTTLAAPTLGPQATPRTPHTRRWRPRSELVEEAPRYDDGVEGDQMPALRTTTQSNVWRGSVSNDARANCTSRNVAAPGVATYWSVERRGT